MSIVDEIVDSMKAHPEKWKWEVVSSQKGEWFCSSCSKQAHVTDHFEIQKKNANSEYIKCYECGRHSFYSVAGWARFVLLKHEAGVVLRNLTPKNDRDWEVQKPAYTTLGFWASRKLNKAVTRLRKQHMKLKLFDIEI